MVFGDMGMKQTLEVLDIWREFLISLFYLSGAEGAPGCGVTRWRKPDYAIYFSREDGVSTTPPFIYGEQRHRRYSIFLLEKINPCTQPTAYPLILACDCSCWSGDPDCDPPHLIHFLNMYFQNW